MRGLLTPSRIVFGICIAFFGVECLAHGRFISGLPPAPPWAPGPPAFAYLLSVVLAIAGLGIAVIRRSGAYALAVALIYLVCAVLLHGQHLHDILLDGGIRTGAFEALSISGAGFVLTQRLSQPTTFFSYVDLLGRILFAFSMLVFGEQHFQYVAFVAPLIPAWIPSHVFFTWLTGACFIAAGIAIGFDRFRSTAALLLGIMLLSWVLILHLPRVLHQPKNSDELISAVVALILSAGSFAIAANTGASHPKA